MQPATLRPLSARFQSTSPLPKSNIIEKSPQGTSAPASSEVWDSSHDPLTSSLDHIDFPTSSTNITNVEPHIGYLKELGLDFGWGPTAIMEWVYEHVHVLSGTPWWQSIILTSVLYRIIVLAIPQVVQSDQMSRQLAMRDVLMPPQKRHMDAAQSGNQYEMQAAMAEVRQIKAAAGIKPWKMFGGPVLQAFLGFGTFTLMRQMAKLPVPGLETGGFLWVHDLTVPDPFYILPVALSATMYWLIKSNGESGVETTAMLPTVKKAMLIGLPSITFLVMAFNPACLQLSFAATSLLGMAQGKLLMQDSVRNFLGLYPLFRPEKKAAPAVIEDKKTVIKRPTQGRAYSQGRGVMQGYQAPTVTSTLKGLPAKGASRTAAPASAKSDTTGGVGGWFRSKVMEPLGKGFGNIKREALAMRGKTEKKETKGQKEFRRKAQDYERRRSREISEDAEYRRDMRSGR